MKKEAPKGPSVRVLRVGEQVRHILSDILARGDVHDDVLTAQPISITEVRMSPESNEVEAEAQFLYDTPPEGKNSMEQICHIRAIPGNADGLWSVVSLRLRGEPYGEGIYNWQMKCCDFFAMLTRALAANEMPDIDELIEDAFHGGERFYDQHGGGGGRAPKIRPSKLLGLKKGRGF